MNDFTKEELNLINMMNKFSIPFSSLEKILNNNAIKLGYINHKDLLQKTGWVERFDNGNNHE